ncbi:EamA family transporter [Microbacterium sp. TNHR37B]|uniref:EamA family transporter n=1 Tax=Microbacterium sp. TNHR37B TaxID=1775956 RepID=UPI0007B2A70C|nr:EamA family transporter [Microbacterium sp. TNHR37B]KZE89646.1 hypothetical protein AVP41_02444 [Microbacterium sp. TNHR37B]
MTIVLALGAALAYGAADFLGGLASRTRSAIAVAAVSAGVGIVIFALLAVAVPGAGSAAAIGAGAASGAAGMTAVACLYRALAIGPMVLVAPLTAVVSGATPVVWAIAHGDRPGPVHTAGLFVILVGAALIAGTPGTATSGSRRRSLPLAALAGILFGALYILLAQAPADSGVLPLLSNRVTGFVVLAGAVGFRLVHRGSNVRAGRHSASRPVAAGLATAAVVGILDATANALYLWAVRDGSLAVVAVLVSLYPAGTVALSAVLLGERIRWLQGMGVAVAFAGVVLLAV